MDRPYESENDEDYEMTCGNRRKKFQEVGQNVTRKKFKDFQRLLFFGLPVVFTLLENTNRLSVDFFFWLVHNFSR